MTQGSTATGERHPAGLRTLFFTEMWERFSFYGMRALLVLFMVDNVRGGMGLSDQVATAIYGLYTAGVYLSSLPGGWVADRLIGARRAVMVGGIIIAAGHFVLAIPATRTFFLGLLLIVIGTGLLKPNISSMVGELYPEGGARRDAGFTIFYMGINIGAALGPLVCSFLGEKVNWHYGFAAAGVGMIFGLIQFKMTGARLGGAGMLGESRPLARGAKRALYVVCALTLLFIALVGAGVVVISPVPVAKAMSQVIVGIAALYFISIFMFGKLTKEEARRVWMIVALFIGAALFWAGFEQVGSSFNLFAERHTVREYWDWTLPAGWFQSLGPVFVISLAPVMAWLWVRLARRNLDPSLGMKFGLALAFLAAGFAVMAVAASLVARSGPVWPHWLVLTYLLHTIGELCLSPVGLSSVTKLSPKRLVGQMMGIWFVASALGNLLAGLLAGEMGGESPSAMSAGFTRLVWMPVLAAVVFMLLAKPMRRWSGH